MHILACVKQTPVSDSVKVDMETGCLVRTGIEAAMNPFDEFALEEAVRTKEKLPGSSVSSLTMGPPQAEAVLRDSVARGGDSCYHLCDAALAGSDTWATSYALAQAIKHISKTAGEIRLVLCGKQTNDSDTGHIGPQLATWLDWPNAAFVRRIAAVTETSVTVERLMEDGTDVLELPLPAVISVIKEINTPRIASLKGRLAAKKAVISKLSAAEIGCDNARLGREGSPMSVVRTFTPSVKMESVTIPGDTPAEKAENLFAALKAKQLI
ncbi:MAG: electron transfer flavoprotein subunit beta/FixA family protein [Elusimicrobiaceae bacterium]|nr:electron transfer flavoprotein subunit beta/FixA family protein [Elusimicrobiaceae bacterium]